MKNAKTSSRRNFFKIGITGAGLFLATRAIAQICGLKTGEQTIGPFFPEPGTPVDPIREDQDKNIPIFLANDNDLTFVKGRSGKASGQVVYVRGAVTDAASCNPIPDATIIIWQASQSGRYNHKGDDENP